MWVLLAPPSGEQRAEMVALFEQKEAAAIAESGGMIAIYD